MDTISSPVFAVGAQTPSNAPQQEEEASNRGAASRAGTQTPAEWSGAPGSFPVHTAEGVTSFIHSFTCHPHLPWLWYSQKGRPSSHLQCLNVCASLSSALQHGITEVKVEETADGHILHLQAEDTLIQLEEDGTHIVCDNNEPLRTTLRDLVLRFLQKL